MNTIKIKTFIGATVSSIFFPIIGGLYYTFLKSFDEKQLNFFQVDPGIAWSGIGGTIAGTYLFIEILLETHQ